MVIYVTKKRTKKKAPLCDMIVSLKNQHTQKKVLSMINSIRHFVEKETYETRRIIKTLEIHYTPNPSICIVQGEIIVPINS